MVENTDRPSEYVYKGLSIKKGGPVDVLARTLWGEARGESNEGIYAVADVVLNRVAKKSWYGKDVVGVCRRPLQFSCWNPSDPNRAKIDVLQADTDYSFRRCLDIAIDVLVDIGSNAREDTVNGATHYHTKACSPPWAKGKTPCKEIGSHLFYNNVE